MGTKGAFSLRGYSKMVYTANQAGRIKKALKQIMDNQANHAKYNFLSCDKTKLIAQLGQEKLLFLLKRMLVIRHLETRAEAAYLQGKIGGFFHAYIGQEAIQTSCVDVFGQNNWWSTSYRCHALAYLTGVPPKDIMSELYGRANGNAMGRGGSMHLYSDRLLGGFGIVGGQVPIAIGAALSIKYLKKEEEVSFCFLGDGAVAQGTFHESLNLAVLWKLPCIIVIENNKWGMGTAVNRAVAMEPIAEHFAKCFGIKGYTIDGMDLLASHQAFQEIKKEMQQERRPILVEAITERFRGHSISDPANYRTKECLQAAMQQDCILKLKHDLIDAGMLTEEQYKALDKEVLKEVLEAVDHAEKSSPPNPIVLEEGVYKEE